MSRDGPRISAVRTVAGRWHYHSDDFESQRGGVRVDRLTGRTPSAVVLAFGVVALMSACTTGLEPAPTTSAVPLAATASPRPAAASSVAATPAATTPVHVASPELTCVAPDEHVLGWLQGSLRDDLPASDAVMVEVGPGDNPSETWWVVAARSYSDAWGQKGEYNPVSFLTTAPNDSGTGGWIAIGRALRAAQGSADWSGVSWTGDRLARGQQAQALALSCIDEPH